MEPPKRKPKKEKKKKEIDETGGIDFGSINATNEFETVTFEFLEPDNTYAVNIYSLLQKTFGFFTGDLFELVEVVGKQKEFGNYLSVEEDDEGEEEPGTKNGRKDDPKTEKDVYGVLSILKLDTKESENVSKYLKKNILEALGDQGDKMRVILESPKGVGLLLSERVINLPYLVVPQMYEQLLADLEFISKCPDYLPEELDYYNYEHIIYFSKSQEKGSEASDEPALPVHKSTERAFYKKEDKILIKNAMFSYQMPSTQYQGIGVTLVVLKRDVFWSLVKSQKLFK